MVCGIMTTYFEIKEVDAMSVIMAYKTDDKIYLGADNRAVSINEDSHRDDENKIIAINNDVAVAFAGCNKSQMLFDMLLKSLKDKSNLKVEDALQYIKKTYRFCKILWFRKFSKEILGLGSQFLVVGKNRNDECCIYAVLISHGKLEKPLLKEWLILPPHGADLKECCDIYLKNVVKYPDNFIQRTVKDIAKMSKYVSPSGDIWIYDIATGKSTSEHFS